MSWYDDRTADPPVVPVPNQGKPNTDPSVEEALSPKEPGSEFRQVAPRYVRAILDELNAVRLELSKIYVKKYGKSNGVNARATYNPYPPLTLEDMEERRREGELEQLERALNGELRVALDTVRADGTDGKPYQGDAIIIGQDRGL